MEQFLATTLRSSAPIALVALGGVFAYRAGIFHLGLEGLMIIGAFVSVAVGITTHSIWLALAGAILADVAVSFVFWFVIVVLRADVIIAGLGLSGVGVGGTAYALETIYKTQGAIQTPIGLWSPVTGVDKGLGVIVSNVDILVWLTPVIAVICWLILRRSRFGLKLAATGEFPFAARTAGVDPARMRMAALLICGVLCALGGADLALGNLQLYSENMTSGRGYIAFTAILFGNGQPIGTALAGLFFGFADALGINTQLNVTTRIPREFVLMLPFIVTILAVWLSGVLRRGSLEAAAGFRELRD